MGYTTLLATLALLVGAAVANVGFKAGHEYEYKYTALTASGIPTLKNQFAGALLQGMIRFQAVNHEEVYMKIERLQAIELNGPVPTGPAEKTLQDLQRQSPQTAQETVELTQVEPALAKAVRVRYENGKVRQIEVSRETPEWAVNIQKAIISLAKLRLNEQQKGASMEKVNRLVKESSDAFLNYAIIEDGVEGQCESTYSVSSNQWEANPNEEVLNVTKIRNLNKCNELPQFTQQTLQDEDCKHCENEKAKPLTNMVVTQYNLRGGRQGFEFERIESQGQILFAPNTRDADVFLTNCSQLLELRRKQPAQQQLHLSSDAKQHHRLQYRFASAEGHQAEELRSRQFDVRKAPITPFNAQSHRGESKKANPQQVSQLISEIAQDIRKAEHGSQQELKNEDVLAKALVAKRLLRALDYQEIEQVYQQAAHQQDKTEKRAAQDIMVMAGSAPAIMVLKKAIESHEIHGEEAALILQQIPTTVFQPHYVLLEEFAKLAKSEAAQRDSQIYSTAMLSYGTLISIACNGTGNSRETPSFVEDNANCPEEMKQRFLNELQQELRHAQSQNSHWRQIVMIQAIGNTLAPEAAEILKPIISGKQTTCPVLRSKAIYALQGAAKVAPRKAVKILAPVYFNQEEMPEIRIAALSMLIAARPEHQFLSKIAASTWTERSQQVGSFTYSALQALTQADNRCMEDLKNDAKQALELANQDFDGNTLDSGVFLYDDDKMDKFNVYNTLIGSWVASNESAMPTSFSLQLNRTEEGLAYKLFQAGLNIKGLDEVINRIAGPKSAFYPIEKITDLFRSESQESHKGLNKLVEALQIDTESRQSADLMVNLYVKLFDTQARNFYVSKQTIKNFLQGKTESAAAKFFEEMVFGNGVRVNYAKIFNTEERLVKMPTPVGLPVIIAINKPVFVAVQGEAKAEIDSSRNPNSLVPTAVRLTVNGRPTLAMKKVTTMGICLPYAKKFAAAGVSRDVKASIPVHARVALDLSEGKLTVVAGRQESNSQAAPLAQFKVTPFTAIGMVNEPKPLSQQQNAKLIHAQDKRQPKQMQMEYFAKSLGLPVIFKVKTEEDLTSQASLIKKAAKQGIWNMLNQWDQPQSYKHREYTVELRTESSETRQAELSATFEFTPAAHQRGLKNHEYTPNALWSYIFGWSSLPTNCEKSSDAARNHYEAEEAEYQQRSSEYSQYDSNEDYSQEQEQDQDYNNKQSSSSRHQQRKQQRKSFWSQWAQNKNQQNSQDDQSSESDESSAEYTQQGWSRRSPSARRSQKNYANRASRYSAINEYKQYNDQEEQHQHQLNVQKISSHENVAAWKLTLKARTIGGQERSAIAVISGARNSAQLKDSIKAEIKIQCPHLQSQQIDFCAEAVAKYPAVPCEFDQTFSPNSVGPIHAEAKATWGHSGCSSNSYVEVSAKIGKSAKQLQREQEAKPWYYKQCMEQRQKGLKFDEACEKMINKVTALNKIELTAKYNNVPLALKNATAKIDNFLKATLYAHMSNNAVAQNQEKQIRIVAEFEPEKKAVNVKIQKPTETTTFTEVRTCLKPLSARRSVAQQVADAVSGRQQPASCDISGGNYINTFNNVTYKHEMGQCTYLAARDCSPNGLFAVLVSGPQSPKSGPAEGIFVEVQLLKNTIKVAPKTSAMDKYEVTINGEKHQLNQDETVIVDSGKQAPGTPDALAYITMSGHYVQVKAPAHGIAIVFDGKDVRVKASDFYKGKMCGLCGPFDAETKDEFVSPKGCIFAQANDFAESYIVPDGQCQNRQHNNRQQCKAQDEAVATYPQLESSKYDDEDEYGHRHHSSSQKYRSQYRNQEQEYRSQEEESRNQEQRNHHQSGRSGESCTTYRNKVIQGSEARTYNRRLSDRLSYSSYESQQDNQDSSEETFDNFSLSENHKDKVCFSTEPVPKCKPGCQASRKETRSVRFHCLDRNDYSAKELLRKQPYQPLDELEGKRADFTKEVQVPTQCSSN
jgi:hypothetical protein